LSAFAQDTRFSPAYTELQHQRAMYAYPSKKWDSLRCTWFNECSIKTAAVPLSTTSCPLAKRMFGWHAIGGSSSSYQWTLLSDLSYFSYDVDPATGNAKNPTQITAFPSDATVVTAVANNVRVSLCATLFNNTNEFATFFSSPAAQSTLITNLLNAVVAANAKGVNIDFEGSGLSGTYLSQFTSFMSTLSTQLHNTVAGSELTIDLQGTYAASSALLTPLLGSVDYFILMGYDYYWNGQFYPGPIAPTYLFPLAAGDPNGHGSVSNDLNNLIKLVGAPKSILAMPYYGRRWRTTNGCVIPAAGNAAAISTQTYTQFRQNSNGYYSNTLRDVNSFTAYHCFNDVSAVPNQQFIDDTFSLQKKYDVIFQRGIAGAAVWRLGYDAGYNDCWNLVNNNLSTCRAVPLTDTLYDMGGPTGNYHNAENYTFTIAPPDAASVTLSFLSFDLENNFDSLYVYDGSSIASPLVGNFSNNIIPPNITSSGGSMTIRFHSDNATVKTGYKAVYTTTLLPAVFKTVSSGNWNVPAVWSTGIVPSVNDSVVIMPSHVITIDAAAAAKNIYISNTAIMNINAPAAFLTTGSNTNKAHDLTCYGTLNISDGNMLLYGDLDMKSGSHFTLSDGQLTIDGNNAVAATSVADGKNLFNISCLPGDFIFSGGVLQFIDPPLGAGSQTISCPYNFGTGSKVVFGNGISTTASNNVNGFGGNALPAQFGMMVLDAATMGNNRIFKNINPLIIKTSCEIKSGNMVQAAALEVSQ
jgi:spore germination protein YaaH